MQFTFNRLKPPSLIKSAFFHKKNSSLALRFSTEKQLEHLALFRFLIVSFYFAVELENRYQSYISHCLAFSLTFCNRVWIIKRVSSFHIISASADPVPFVVHSCNNTLYSSFIAFSPEYLSLLSILCSSFHPLKWKPEQFLPPTPWWLNSFPRHFSNTSSKITLDFKLLIVLKPFQQVRI